MTPRGLPESQWAALRWLHADGSSKPLADFPGLNNRGWLDLEKRGLVEIEYTRSPGVGGVWLSTEGMRLLASLKEGS